VSKRLSLCAPVIRDSDLQVWACFLKSRTPDLLRAHFVSHTSEHDSHVALSGHIIYDTVTRSACAQTSGLFYCCLRPLAGRTRVYRQLGTPTDPQVMQGVASRVPQVVSKTRAPPSFSNTPPLCPDSTLYVRSPRHRFDFIHTVEGIRCLAASAGIDSHVGLKLDSYHWWDAPIATVPVVFAVQSNANVLYNTQYPPNHNGR